MGLSSSYSPLGGIVGRIDHPLSYDIHFSGVINGTPEVLCTIYAGSVLGVCYYFPGGGYEASYLGYAISGGGIVKPGATTSGGAGSLCSSSLYRINGPTTTIDSFLYEAGTADNYIATKVTNHITYEVSSFSTIVHFSEPVTQDIRLTIGGIPYLVEYGSKTATINDVGTITAVTLDSSSTTDIFADYEIG